MQSSNEVYQAPEAELDKPEESKVYELASRLERLKASLIDIVIFLLVYIPIVHLTRDAYFKWHPFLGFFESLDKESIITISANLYFVPVSLVVFLLIHGYLLAKNGQTLGKKIVGIAIVSNTTNTKPPMWKLILLRYCQLFLWRINLVASGVCILINWLFIFGKEQRCLHDLVANTKVVRVR